MPKTNSFLRYAAFFAPDLPLPMDLLAKLVGMPEARLTASLANEGKLVVLSLGAILDIYPDNLPEPAIEDGILLLEAVIQWLQKGLNQHNKVRQLESFRLIGPHMVTLIEKLSPFQLPNQWQLYSLMAQYLMLVGKTEEACEYFQQAANCYPEPITAEDPLFNHLILERADAETARGNYALAAQLVQDVIDKETLANGQPQSQHLIQLAHIMFREKDYPKAIELYQKTIRLVKEAGGNKNLAASYWNNLGRIYLSAGQVKEAIDAFNRSASLWGHADSTEHHMNRSLALKNLALAFQETKEYAKAQTAIEEAIQLSESEYGLDHPDIGRDANIYALILQAQGQHQAALEQFRRALRIDTHAFGELHPEVALTLNNMGTLYAEMGEIEKARQNFTDARRILERCSSESHPYWQQVMENIEGLDQV
ncbi:MAG: tetratricopeptide repeat protein [Anaerolineae bacterium]|nr:tetratricopeptide repeat protein [Anaerolineae bacterium]